MTAALRLAAPIRSASVRPTDPFRVGPPYRSVPRRSALPIRSASVRPVDPFRPYRPLSFRAVPPVFPSKASQSGDF